MRERICKILCVTICLLMIAAPFLMIGPTRLKPETLGINEVTYEEEETHDSVVLKDRGTRAWITGNGTMFNEALPTFNASGYGISWSAGVRFSVNMPCLVQQLGIYNGSYYDIYGISLWSSSHTRLRHIADPNVSNNTWGWFSITPITFTPGQKYIISMGVKGDIVPCADNPGTTSDGIVNPEWWVYRDKPSVFPIYDETTGSVLPLVDFNYSYDYWVPDPPPHDITVPDNYSTIQEAIDAANVGDTIFVRENTIPYNEELTINKTITLLGEDKDTTIIDANGIGGGSGTTVYITGNTVKISGFTITGGNIGIYCDHTKGTIIRYNRIIENNDYGLCLDYSSNDTIRENYISYNDFDGDEKGFGIHALYSHAKGVWNNIISYNKVGVKLTDSWLWGCVNWNTFIGNDVAVEYDPEPLEIDSNIFIDNTIAIKISGDDSLLTITNNTITGSEFGIYIETGSPIIEGNTFENCQYAIYYLNGSSPVIANNTFSDNVFDIYHIILAVLDMDPDTLNIKSKGRWITGYIRFPEGCDVNEIDISTIMLNDVIPAEWGNIQNDILMVKFDRSEIEDCNPTHNFEFTITGELMDGSAIEGHDTIRVINPP